MNHYDIDDAAVLLQNTPIYGPAAQYLQGYKDLINSNSDGWPYWSSGTKASKSLQAIVEEGVHLKRPWGAYRDTKPTATEQGVRKAVARIKRFWTGYQNRRKLRLPRLPELTFVTPQRLPL